MHVTSGISNVTCLQTLSNTQRWVGDRVKILRKSNKESLQEFVLKISGVYEIYREIS